MVRTRGASLISFSSRKAGDTDHTGTVREMKKILRNESRVSQCCLYFLAPLPSKMLKLPTSPLKVSLQCVDASVMSNDDGNGSTPLHWLAELNDPSQEHKLENQCILAKQLIATGANVNARAQRCVKRMTPLHGACRSSNCTNLDLI